MASHTSLRQASRIVQSSRSYIAPSRIRQYSQSTSTLLSSRATSFSKHPRIYSHHVLQQSRNLSWWGSAPSTPATPSSIPSQEAPTSSNLNISEPSDLQNYIAPDRSFKASPNYSSAELEAQASSTTPSPIEPQILEDFQRAILKPNYRDPSTLPTNLEEIPERIGYLKEECGLDFGWGPTAICENLLEQLHITGQFSWTVSIILLGVTVRAIVFPALIKAAKATQKLRDVKDVIAPIKEEYNAAKAKSDQVAMGKAAQRLMAVQKEFGVNPWGPFIAPAVQIPFGFGCWRLLRNSAEIPVPGFVTESWLWTSDLTFSDPYFIAPAVSALLIWLTMKTNATVNTTTASKDVMTMILKVIPFLTFGFMCIQPGAVQLYFISSSFVGLLSAVILQQAPIRAYFNMPPLGGAAATSKIPILSRSSPAQPPKAATPAAAPRAAPMTPPPVPAKIGGLHRTSWTVRVAEAERQARIAAEKAARQESEVSRLDKVADGTKELATKLSPTKNYKEFTEAWRGFRGTLSGRFSEAQKAKQKVSDDVAQREARIQEKLDLKRKNRNEMLKGQR